MTRLHGRPGPDHPRGWHRSAYLSGPFANRGDVEVEITSGRHTITRTVHVVGEPAAVTGVSALDAKVAADGARSVALTARR